MHSRGNLPLHLPPGCFVIWPSRHARAPVQTLSCTLTICEGLHEQAMCAHTHTLHHQTPCSSAWPQSPHSAWCAFGLCVCSASPRSCCFSAQRLDRSVIVAHAGHDVQRLARGQALLGPPRQQPLKQHCRLHTHSVTSAHCKHHACMVQAPHSLQGQEHAHL